MMSGLKNHEKPSQDQDHFAGRKQGEAPPKMLPFFDKSLYTTSIHDQSDRIFMAANVYDAILKQALQQTGASGVLFGSWSQSNHGDFVDVFSCVPSAPPSAFSEDLLQKMYLKQKEQFPECFILGFYCIHQEGTSLSREELDIYQEYFSLPWQICLIVNHSGRQCVFQWNENSPVTGHVYIYANKQETLSLRTVLDAHKVLRAETLTDITLPHQSVNTDKPDPKEKKKIVKLEQQLVDNIKDLSNLNRTVKEKNMALRIAKASCKDVKTLRTNLDARKAELTDVKSRIQGLEKTIQEKEGALSAQNHALETLRNRVVETESSSTTEQENKSSQSMHAEVNRLQEIIKNQAVILTTRKRQLEGIRKEVAAGDTEKTVDKITKLEKTLREKNLLISKRDNEMQSLRSKITEIEASGSNIKTSFTSAQEELRKLRSNAKINKHTSCELETAQKEIETLQTQAGKDHKEIEKLNNVFLKEASDKIRKLEDQIAKREHEVTQILSRNDSKYQEETTQLSKEFEKSKQAVEVIRIENNRLKDQLEHTSGKTSGKSKKRIGELESEVATLTSKISEFDSKHPLFATDNRLQEETSRKDREIENLSKTISRLRTARFKQPGWTYAVAASILGIVLGTIGTLSIKPDAAPAYQSQPSKVYTAEAPELVTPDVASLPESVDEAQETPLTVEDAEIALLDEDVAMEDPTGDEIDVLASVSDIPETSVPTESAREAEHYVVRHNDNLWKIAAHVLGDGGRWQEIAKINNLTEHDYINPGDRLVLPDR